MKDPFYQDESNYRIVWLIRHTFLPKQYPEKYPCVFQDQCYKRLALVAIQFSLLYDVTLVLNSYKYFEYHKTFKSTNIVNMLWEKNMYMSVFSFLYYKPLVPVGFIETGWTCLLSVIWCRFFRFFIVTPQIFYVLSWICWERREVNCCYSLKCI